MQKPSLSQYGLEHIDIDELVYEYNKYVSDAKQKSKSKEMKANLGFIITLFTWCGPLVGVNLILALIFKWDISPGTMAFMLIYAIFGTAFLFYWGKLAEDADKSKKGMPSVNDFYRKSDWLRYQQYKKDYDSYIDWVQKCNRDYWTNLSGLEFEEEVAKLYSSMGFKTIKTRASNDGGVDVILIKGNSRIAVQCKAHRNKISPNVARELYGVMCVDNYTSGIIASISGASDETINFCSKCHDRPIQIIDVNDLIRMKSTM